LYISAEAYLTGLPNAQPQGWGCQRLQIKEDTVEPSVLARDIIPWICT